MRKNYLTERINTHERKHKILDNKRYCDCSWLQSADSQKYYDEGRLSITQSG